MKKLYNLLVKLSDVIFLAEKYLLLLAVVVVVAVNFVNVCMRYLMGSSLNFCETLSVCLFMFMVLIGGNIAVKTDGEIRIDFSRFKSAKMDAGYRLISDIISIMAIVLMIAGLFATVESVMMHLQKVTPLPIYTYHIYIAMTVGFFMILLDHVIILLKHILIIMGQQPEGGARTI